MASTVKAGNVVAEVRTLATKIIELAAELNKTADRYTRNGGQTFLHPFFLNADGTTRTDLDVTEAQIITAVSAIQQMSTWVSNKMDVFIQAE